MIPAPINRATAKTKPLKAFRISLPAAARCISCTLRIRCQSAVRSVDSPSKVGKWRVCHFLAARQSHGSEAFAYSRARRLSWLLQILNREECERRASSSPDHRIPLAAIKPRHTIGRADVRMRTGAGVEIVEL
jgi:hypothetical protein